LGRAMALSSPQVASPLFLLGVSSRKFVVSWALIRVLNFIIFTGKQIDVRICLLHNHGILIYHQPPTDIMQVLDDDIRGVSFPPTSSLVVSFLFWALAPLSPKKNVPILIYEMFVSWYKKRTTHIIIQIYCEVETTGKHVQRWKLLNRMR
jgi:hypothetical protein